MPVVVDGVAAQAIATIKESAAETAGLE